MKNSEIIYDTIIIGGGASGLYAAAQSPKQNGLIIYKGKIPGAKLLMSGGGQCNLTHGRSIKEFPQHYGANGKKIRSILYRHSNEAVVSYFAQKGVPLTEREDGRIFPKSLKSSDILSVLMDECKQKGFEFCNNSVVRISTINDEERVIRNDRDNLISEINDAEQAVYNGNIERISEINDDKRIAYKVTCAEAEYKCRKLIIATGGCSYPETGSDGSMFRILEEMGVDLVPRRPALSPVFVQDYPYAALAGISLQDVEVRMRNKTTKGDLLFTHKNFSGPVMLDCSHLMSDGDEIRINYLPKQLNLEGYLKQIQPHNDKQLVSVITNLADNIPKSFAEVIADRAQISRDKKFSSLTGNELKKICSVLTQDILKISDTGPCKTAMLTAGGVDLGAIDLKTMECKKYPGIYIVGEALDVNGDTGGYNLQFAFSSAYVAVNATKHLDK